MNESNRIEKKAKNRSVALRAVYCTVLYCTSQECRWQRKWCNRLVIFL